MMRRYFGVSRFAILTAVLVLATGSANATGIGGYIGFASGGGEVTVENGSATDFSIGTTSVGFGLTLDTNLTGDGFFNYRLNVGPDFFDVGVDEGNDADLAGLTIVNDFGFRVWSNDSTRVWLGPEFRLGFYTGDNDVDDDVYLAAVGLGFVVGANFSVTDSFVISPSAGVVGNLFIGEQSNGIDLDLDGDNVQGVLTVGFVFNLGR